MTLLTNKTYNEDCLVTMAQMDDNFIDLVVTSPPYDNMRTYNDLNWGPGVWRPVFKELFRVIKSGGVAVWIVGDGSIKGSETGTSFKQALHAIECGFRLHDTMIWNKGSFAFPSNGRYHQTFEYMFVFSKGKPKTFNPIKDRKNLYLGKRGASGRYPDGTRKTATSEVVNEYGTRFNIWYHTIGGNKCTLDKVAYDHPAIFPEQLVKDHITSWSSEDDLVYDPFMGSGTTAKMAKQAKRNYIGSEISEQYCEIIEKRLKG